MHKRLGPWCGPAFAAALAISATTAHCEPADADYAPCRHAYAFLGEPKLPPDFEHFDWVNPNAPKGGLMRMADTGSWDTFNRMGLGHSVRGMDTRGNSTRHIYDSLVIRNPTEPATVYGLIAECIAVAPDGAWIEFRLRDGVYWHDGEPLDAEDVAFSFHVYQDKAHPAIAVAVAGFAGVEILDGNRVRYHVRPGHRHNRLLPIRIGELPVLSKRYWTRPGNDPGKPASTPPLGSGPYRIGGYEFGRWILWERDPDYWGRDLPPSRGRYNFDRVKYDYFRDDQMRTEAVKGDIVDIHVENVPRRWATAYDFPPADAGVFRRQLLPQSQPSVLWWPIFWNQRQARFQDIRVREALWLVNDFAWSNRRIGYGFYDVATSFFYRSRLAATGLPSERELTLLEPIRHLVPPRVFTEPYAPPPHQGTGWHRDNLLRAAELFREAGWVVENKRLVHERTGEPFFLRFVMFSPALARSVIPYTHVLRRLGIESTVKSPELSNWLYRMRSGDFDAGVNWFPAGQHPDPHRHQHVLHRLRRPGAERQLGEHQEPGARPLDRGHAVGDHLPRLRRRGTRPRPGPPVELLLHPRHDEGEGRGRLLGPLWPAARDTARPHRLHRQLVVGSRQGAGGCGVHGAGVMFGAGQCSTAPSISRRYPKTAGLPITNVRFPVSGSAARRSTPHRRRPAVKPHLPEAARAIASGLGPCGSASVSSCSWLRANQPRESRQSRPGKRRHRMHCSELKG